MVGKKVLKGLEAVRKRPGMYIGDTDDGSGLHHMVFEVLDNCIDEAMAGHCSDINVIINKNGSVTVKDDGRGIPVDVHKKEGISAAELILTTLHSGGKFDDNSYKVSGGLHGVGASVVNALSINLDVEVARDRKLYKQTFSKGKPTSLLVTVGSAPNRRGTSIQFSPDPEIFGDGCHFKPAILYKMAKSKAYLFAGVEIRWKCSQANLSRHRSLPNVAVPSLTTEDSRISGLGGPTN
mgnify:CR=1 FL=1